MNIDASFISLALLKMAEFTHLTGYWNADGNDLDGYLEIEDPEGTVKGKLPVIVRKQVLSSQLAEVVELKNRYPSLTVIAGRIPPEVRGQFKEQQINYLDSAGNAFLHMGELFIFIDGQKEYPPAVQQKRRLFTKTGLRVVFHLLAVPGSQRLTYRELSEKLNTSLGSITHTFQELKRAGFLLAKGKTDRQVYDRKTLLSHWIPAYMEQLKPDLLMGRFRFADRDAQQRWPGLALPPQTCWGGEPAAYLLTRRLKPAEFTLYSDRQAVEVMKSLRLLPDKEGTVWVYRKFWSEEIRTAAPTVAPTLLVYGDLIGTGVARNIEIAQHLFDEYLAEEF